MESNDRPPLKKVNTRPLTHGRVHALHSARHVTSEEAARLVTSSLDRPEGFPKWLLAAVFLTVGFIIGEARFACVVQEVLCK